MASFIEVCVLVLIAWPLWQAVFHPALRRAFPRTAAVLVGLILASGSVVGCLVYWFPHVLHLLTVVAVMVCLAAIWHARPGYGRSRRLPPGSLSPLPFCYITDPFFFQRQIDRYGRVFKMNQFGVGAGPNPLRGFLQPVCCVDLELGIEILRDHDKQLHPPAIPSSRFIPKRYLREMKPDDHRRYRQLFSSAFLPSVVDECAEFIAEHVRRSLRRMADKSACQDSGGVEPEPLLTEMSLGVFVRCFYGILPDDHRYRTLTDLIRVIDLSNRNDREVTNALEGLASILRVEEGRTRVSSHDLPRSFLSEIARTEPGALDDLTAMRNLIYIAQASWIDTSGLIVWLFKELCDHPSWTARLADDSVPTGSHGDVLSVRFVKETLRLRQSEYIYRQVLDDIPVGEFTIPRGWLLRVCVRESHRDRRLFENPNTFNPDRFLDRRYTPKEYSTFGASRISCLGEHLTMTLGRIFVDEVARTVTTSVIRDGPLEYRRWHWKPSSNWKVRVTRLVREPSSKMAVGRPV